MAKKPISAFTIGIDLGGTKIAAGLVDAAGKCVLQIIKPTHPSGLTPAARDAVNREVSPLQHIHFVVKSMADAVEELLARVPKDARGKKPAVAAVGLASAGPMDVVAGRLLNPANFQGWKNVPIRSMLEKALDARGLHRTVAFQNDAIAAALGEGWTGAARGCRTFAMITLGTGVGSGVILNGQPAQSDGMGSEWGHMIINASGVQADPDDYESRTAEGMCSGTGILRRARARGHTGASVSKLADAARAGDALAVQVFTEAGEALACFMFNLSLGFHCEKIVIGGGLLPIKDLFLPRALSLYKTLIHRKSPAFLARITTAKLGNGAGVVGAGRLARGLEAMGG